MDGGGEGGRTRWIEKGMQRKVRDNIKQKTSCRRGNAAQMCVVFNYVAIHIKPYRLQWKILLSLSMYLMALAFYIEMYAPVLHTYSVLIQFNIYIMYK